MGRACVTVLILSNGGHLCISVFFVQCERVESASVGVCTFGPDQTGSPNPNIWNSCWGILQTDRLFFWGHMGPGLRAEVNTCCDDPSQHSVIAVLTCLVLNYEPGGLRANLWGAPWKKRQEVVHTACNLHAPLLKAASLSAYKWGGLQLFGHSHTHTRKLLYPCLHKF